MPSLQRFKLFASHCAAVNIPTQSPTTSPLFHLRNRRRKTLRMFLTRRPQISDSEPPATTTITTSVSRRSKLKDLFFSASSSPTNFTHRRDDGDREPSEIEPKRPGVEIGPGSVRPVNQLFGCRSRMLLRRHWRPVLSTIEEIKE